MTKIAAESKDIHEGIELKIRSTFCLLSAVVRWKFERRGKKIGGGSDRRRI